MIGTCRGPRAAGLAGARALGGSARPLRLALVDVALGAVEPAPGRRGCWWCPGWSGWGRSCAAAWWSSSDAGAPPGPGLVEQLPLGDLGRLVDGRPLCGPLTGSLRRPGVAERSRPPGGLGER